MMNCYDSVATRIDDMLNFYRVCSNLYDYITTADKITGKYHKELIRTFEVKSGAGFDSQTFQRYVYSTGQPYVGDFIH